MTTYTLVYTHSDKTMNFLTTVKSNQSLSVTDMLEHIDIEAFAIAHGWWGWDFNDMSIVTDVKELFANVHTDKYGEWAHICSGCFEELAEHPEIKESRSADHSTTCDIRSCDCEATNYVGF